jgi:hypothetical protein
MIATLGYLFIAMLCSSSPGDRRNSSADAMRAWAVSGIGMAWRVII